MSFVEQGCVKIEKKSEIKSEFRKEKYCVRQKHLFILIIIESTDRFEHQDFLSLRLIEVRILYGSAKTKDYSINYFLFCRGFIRIEEACVAFDLNPILP